MKPLCLVLLCLSLFGLCHAPCSARIPYFSVHSVHSVAFSPDGRTLASGSEDQTIKLWDAATGKLRRTMTGHTDAVLSVAFSPDGRTLASGSGDNTIKLWDTATGKLRRSLTGHTKGINSVAFSPDGRTLASGSDDETFKLWDLETGQELRTLTLYNDPISSVAFSPDGKVLAGGGGSGTTLSDTATGHRLRSLFVGSAYDHITSIAFSPDGRTLASGSNGLAGTVRLWDTGTGKELHTVFRDTVGFTSVAFSPDSKAVASGRRNAVNLWDAATGQELRTLTAHTTVILSVAFSPDGKTVAGGSFDGTINLWDSMTGKLRRTFAAPLQYAASHAHPMIYQKILSPSLKLVVTQSEVPYVFPKEPEMKAKVQVPDHVYLYSFRLVSSHGEKTLWTLRVPDNLAPDPPSHFDVLDTSYDGDGLTVVYKLSGRHGSWIVNANVIRSGVKDSNVHTPLLHSTLLGDSWIPKGHEHMYGLFFKSASITGSIARDNLLVTVKSQTEEGVDHFDYAYKGGTFVALNP